MRIAIFTLSAVAALCASFAAYGAVFQRYAVNLYLFYGQHGLWGPLGLIASALIIGVLAGRTPYGAMAGILAGAALSLAAIRREDLTTVLLLNYIGGAWLTGGITLAIRKTCDDRKVPIRWSNATAATLIASSIAIGMNIKIQRESGSLSKFNDVVEFSNVLFSITLPVLFLAWGIGQWRAKHGSRSANAT